MGDYFSKSPNGIDGIWPHETVRDIVEKIKSKDFESGLEIGKLNARGGTSRSYYEGGQQERGLAEQYTSDADKLNLKWPRTAEIPGLLLDIIIIMQLEKIDRLS